jgi:hypothetical protein
LVQLFQKQQQSTVFPLRWPVVQVRLKLQQAWQLEHNIYVVFCPWLSIGILWGMLDQHRDPITAIHFAVSALAMGGLTAPEVNVDGILPTGHFWISRSWLLTRSITSLQENCYLV